MPELIEPGTVWLVGAGPGDPDLLTRKAERLIAEADIVFFDALVGPAVLNLVPPHAEQISVGKRSGHHSKDQKNINALLVKAAMAGKRVVRLKGGDPSIFGRSAEEMEELAAHGILCRICPGITAASAAAANAGVSLTLRGLARKLVLITAHAKAGEALNLDWASLADPDATLAIYMGKAAAANVARELQQCGLARETPALIIENASLPGECITFTSVAKLGKTAKLVIGDGPALMLIGKALKSAPRQLQKVENAMSHFAPALFDSH